MLAQGVLVKEWWSPAVNSLKGCRELEDACRGVQDQIRIQFSTESWYSIGGDGSSDHEQLLKR